MFVDTSSWKGQCYLSEIRIQPLKKTNLVIAQA